MSSRTTVPPSKTTRMRFAAREDVAAAVLFAATVMLMGVLLPRLQPEHVASFTVDNTTTYELFVEVRGADPGWTPVAVVYPRHTAQTSSLIDQGERWTFRFSGQGADGGAIELTRAQLEANGWRVEVGADVEARLREQGAPPSPPR